MKILILILFIIIIIILSDLLIDRVINIILLIRKDREYHEGMIYNNQKDILEPDNSKILL